MAEVTGSLTGETARIHHDIDRTRMELDRKLDALEDRLTPRELAHDAWEAVRIRSRDSASRIWDSAMEYPLPAATIVAGIGWFLYSRGLAGGRHRHRSGIGDGAARTAAELGRRASNAASAIRENAARFVDRTRGRRRRGDSIRHLFNDRPWVMGGLCLVAGIAAGLLIPASRRERKWIRAQRDRLVDTARAAGRQVLERGRQVAEAAIDAAHAAASEPESH
jgi:hypothetical protein